MACGELVARLLQTYKHPEHGYRSCLGLLSLSRRYGNARLEAACERALALRTFRYRHVRNLLTNNRDLVPQEASAGARQCARPRLLPMTLATPAHGIARPKQPIPLEPCSTTPPSPNCAH